METIFGAIFCVAMIAVVIITSRLKKKSIQKIYEQFQEKDFAYTLVFKSNEWGPGTEKIILNTGKITENFDSEKLGAENFNVSVKSEISDGASGTIVEKEKTVPVKRAYLCDIDGNEIIRSDEDSDSEIPYDETGSATHIALEIESSSGDAFSSPFIYDPAEKCIRWKKIYDFKIGHSLFENDMSECSDWFSPDAQKFRPLKNTGTLNAFSYIPENVRPKEKSAHPLLVLILGEKSRTDVPMTVLENYLTPLVAEEIQTRLGGLFVFCMKSESEKTLSRFVKKNRAVNRDRITLIDISESDEKLREWIKNLGEKNQEN